MKNINMEWLFIGLSVLGFTTWAFFHIGFIRDSNNYSTATRLQFPIVVPIFAAVIIYLGYWIYFRHTPNQVVIDTFQQERNLKYFLFSSIGLALGYFTYAIAISYPNNKNAAIITALNVVCITCTLFFLRFKNDKIEIGFMATMPEIIGALMTIAGIVLMKYGNQLFDLKK